MRQAAILGLVCIASMALFACGGPVAECDRGDAAARSGKHSDAISLLTRCLDDSSLSADQRRRALEGRAWSYANADVPAKAVVDQEEAFRLRPPAEYHELINFASYLREVGRFEDSLGAIKKAEKLGTAEPSMMTQYHLGWTLYELGRNEEAVEAFSRGVTNQPDYAFVYWRRGLAYERLGKTDAAREDFRKLAELLKGMPSTGTPNKLMPEIRTKLAAYGVS